MQEREDSELNVKPMTPRRVKRRSVMARGSNSRTSTNSRRSHGGRSHDGNTHSTGTHTRSSTRSSRRKYQQNPVTKLLDQQQLQLKHQQQQQHQHVSNKQQFGSFHHHKSNPTLTASNLHTLNQEISSSLNNNSSSLSTNNIISSSSNVTSLSKTNNNQHYHSFRKNIPPDPIYYNTNAMQAAVYRQSWQMNSHSPIAADDDAPVTPTTPSSYAGHFNPTYQHSITNLNDAAEHNDEMHNNRPPSVRSSYSNFHGTRPVSSYYSTQTAGENVFAGLTATATSQTQSQPQQPLQQLPAMQHVAPSTPPLYQQHPLHEQQHLPLPSPDFVSSTTQHVPFAKRTASRESIRSMAFLSSGPPAYNLNYHTPPDSETTM